MINSKPRQISPMEAKNCAAGWTNDALVTGKMGPATVVMKTTTPEKIIAEPAT